MIITKKEWDYVLKMKDQGPFYLEVDFGLRKVEVEATLTEMVINKTIKVKFPKSVKEGFCYDFSDLGVQKMAFFSFETNKFYKLIPTQDWPSVAIGSVPMHKLKSPKTDTENKIALIKPSGNVLDTCMGLGYTSILSSQLAKRVLTFERDENVFILAQYNPLSERLFTAENIEIIKEDVSQSILELYDETFDCIIHDPPTFTISPELFSVKFYEELRRVLKRSGRMYHYAPLYKVSQGYNFPSKIKSKLKEVGFKVSDYSEEAGGFLCRK